MQTGHTSLPGGNGLLASRSSPFDIWRSCARVKSTTSWYSGRMPLLTRLEGWKRHLQNHFVFAHVRYVSALPSLLKVLQWCSVLKPCQAIRRHFESYQQGCILSQGYWYFLLISTKPTRYSKKRTWPNSKTPARLMKKNSLSLVPFFVKNVKSEKCTLKMPSIKTLKDTGVNRTFSINCSLRLTTLTV